MDTEVFPVPLARAIAHAMHEVQLVRYGCVNVALECMDCGCVVGDQEIGEGAVLLALYEEIGPTGVYDHVNDSHPEWEWDGCEPCEVVTPTWDDGDVPVCAVCWTPR